MTSWREIIGHDGYLRADLHLNPPAEGARQRHRTVQSGYHASWWLIKGEEERWLGSGPLDVVEGPSIKPGATGPIKIYPMHPPDWVGVGPGAVLHLRERRELTLGVAVVAERVHVPDDAPIRLDVLPVRPGQAVLVARRSIWERIGDAARRRKI